MTISIHKSLALFGFVEGTCTYLKVHPHLNWLPRQVPVVVNMPWTLMLILITKKASVCGSVLTYVSVEHEVSLVV